MEQKYILVSFIDNYNKVYEQYDYVFIITKEFVRFEINDVIKYKVFKVSQIDNNSYETLIQILFSKLPFQFYEVTYLDMHSNLHNLHLDKCSLQQQNKYDPSKIQLVVAYYNEDLSWIEHLQKECCINNILIISKKHQNHPKYKSIHLPNVGRESHSFMWYIINHYDNLPETIFFSLGGVNSNNMKYQKFLFVVKNLAKVKDLGIVTVPGHLSFRYSPFDYDFTLDEWKSSTISNNNDEFKLIPSCLRPFGKWYETYISNDLTKISKYGVSYNSIFCTTNDAIRKYPKSLYEALYDQLSVGDNIEVGHYIERVYFSMFSKNYLIDNINSKEEYHILNVQNNILLNDDKILNTHINNRVYQFSLLLKDALLYINKHISSLKIGYIYSDIGTMKDYDILNDCDIIFNIVNTYPTKRKTTYTNIVQLGSFGFQCFGQDEYERETQIMLEVGKTTPTHKKIVWYGNINTNPIRILFYSIAKANSDLFHVVNVDKSSSSDIWDNPNFKSMPEQAQIGQFLIDLPGNGWSARLQTLLFSNRPVLVVKPNFVEHWFYDLVPWKHYIPIKPDLSDLLVVSKWCFENEDITLDIAKNALEYAKQNLRREHEVMRIRDRIYDLV